MTPLGIVIYCVGGALAAGGLAYMLIVNHDLARHNDALERANRKMKDYINKRDIEGWDAAVTNRNDERYCPPSPRSGYNQPASWTYSKR